MQIFKNLEKDKEQEMVDKFRWIEEKYITEL